MLEDPARFDIDEIDSALRIGVALSEHDLDPGLIDLINRLSYSPIGEDLTARALALLPDSEITDARTLLTALRAFSWFLDRAADGDIQLTSAGYLKPADVQAAARTLPTMGAWIGKANREIETEPVLRFRKLLQSLGLLRKYKGTLRLTRVGANAQASPELLWSTLADKLVPTNDEFEGQATRLLLVYAATSAGAEFEFGAAADALTYLGWRTADDQPIERYDLYGLPVLDILTNVSNQHTDHFDRWRISSAAAELARAALWRP